jgi:hypothetical protein
MKTLSIARAAIVAMLIAAPVAAFAHPTTETARTHNGTARNQTPSARTHTVPSQHGR